MHLNKNLFIDPKDKEINKQIGPKDGTTFTKNLSTSRRILNFPYLFSKFQPYHEIPIFQIVSISSNKYSLHPANKFHFMLLRQEG